jgi:hypothetical protein
MRSVDSAWAAEQRLTPKSAAAQDALSVIPQPLSRACLESMQFQGIKIKGSATTATQFSHGLYIVERSASDTRSEVLAALVRAG